MAATLTPLTAAAEGNAVSASAGGALNATQQARNGRLRWHCRRALLELDIIFQRFWAQVGDDLDEATATTLERLLEMQDHDMWELVSGRSATDDPQIKGLVERLRGLSATAGR